MDAWLATLLQVLLTLVLAAAVEVPVALRITRPKVREDTQASIAAAKADLLAEFRKMLDEQKPGQMRGGVDPQALNEAKAAKAEAKAIERTKAEAAFKVFVAERMGEKGFTIARSVLGDTTLEGIFSAGSRWFEAAQPFLNKLPQRNGTDAAAAEATVPYALG